MLPPKIKSMLKEYIRFTLHEVEIYIPTHHTHTNPKLNGSTNESQMNTHWPQQNKNKNHNNIKNNNNERWLLSASVYKAGS